MPPSKKTSKKTYLELLDITMLKDAKEGNKRAVEHHLAEGADILTVGKKGNTMLHYAAMYGWEDIAASAIEKNLAIDVKNTDGDTPLLTAARYLRSHHHSSSIIPYLLKNKANVHAKTAHDETALHFVAEGENIALAEALLDHGADINARDNQNMTPLLHIGRGGTLEMAEWLLDHGADITLTSSNPEITLLHVAASKNWLSLISRALEAKVDIEAGAPLLHAATYGHKESVKLLLRHGATLCNQKLIPTRIPYEEETFSSNSSVLYYAAKHGWDDIVKLCLEAGISIEATDANGYTPLLIAAKHGHKETVQLLLKKNASISPTRDFLKYIFRSALPQFSVLGLVDSNVHAHSIFGYDTLLHFAAKYGWIDIAEQCVKRGTIIWREGKEHQLFPLLYAAENGQKKMVVWLLEQGADMQDHDCYGRTLLHYAAKQGWKDVIEKYFPANTGTMKVFSTPQSPLLEAAEHGHKTTVEWFLKHGATISSSTTGLKHTLLHYAAQYGWTEIAEKCLKAGLSIDVQPDFGDTPLLYAARHRNKNMVEWLLKHGADILIGDLDGTTVLHHAATHGWLDIAEKCHTAHMSLEQEGHGYSPLNLAINSGQRKMVKWLVQKGVNVCKEQERDIIALKEKGAILAALERSARKKISHSYIDELESPVSSQPNEIITELQPLDTEQDNCNDNNTPPQNAHFSRPEREQPKPYHHSHESFRQALAVFKQEFCPKQPFSCYVIYPRDNDSLTEKVTGLVDYLRDAGITVHYESERKYTLETFHEFINKTQNVNYVIVVGTRSLLQQYLWKASPENPTEIAPPAHAELDSIEGQKTLTPHAFTLLPVLFEQTADVALPSFVRPYVHTERHLEHGDYFTIVHELILAMHGLSPEDSRFKEGKNIFTKPPSPLNQAPSSVVEELRHSMEDFASTVRQVQGTSAAPSTHLPSRTLPTQQEVGR